MLNNFDSFENSVVNGRYLTAPFAGMGKWQILYIFLGCSGPLWLKLTMLLKYSDISLFFFNLLFYAWTPSQFYFKKSKSNGYTDSLFMLLILQD